MVESFHEILNEVSSKGTEMDSSEVKVALTNAQAKRL